MCTDAYIQNINLSIHQHYDSLLLRSFHKQMLSTRSKPNTHTHTHVIPLACHQHSNTPTACKPRKAVLDSLRTVDTEWTRMNTRFPQNTAQPSLNHFHPLPVRPLGNCPRKWTRFLLHWDARTSDNPNIPASSPRNTTIWPELRHCWIYFRFCRRRRARSDRPASGDWLWTSGKRYSARFRIPLHGGSSGEALTHCDPGRNQPILDLLECTGNYCRRRCLCNPGQPSYLEGRVINLKPLARFSTLIYWTMHIFGSQT